MAEIVESAEKLDECGRQLRQAIEEEAVARLAYDRKVEIAKLEAFHAAKKMGERPPAEDIRTADAHRLAEDEYARYLTAKASTEGLRAWQVSLRASTSARQTLLSLLKAESMVEMPYQRHSRER
jgi:hypothetical protein